MEISRRRKLEKMWCIALLSFGSILLRPSIYRSINRSHRLANESVKYKMPTIKRSRQSINAVSNGPTIWLFGCFQIHTHTHCALTFVLLHLLFFIFTHISSPTAHSAIHPSTHPCTPLIHALARAHTHPPIHPSIMPHPSIPPHPHPSCSIRIHLRQSPVPIHPDSSSVPIHPHLSPSIHPSVHPFYRHPVLLVTIAIDNGAEDNFEE